MTDIEKVRAQNIMRLNHRMNQLGIRRLAEIVQQSNSKKKPRGKGQAHRQQSESTALEAEASSPPARGPSSKRVLAPDSLEQTRCTRQRTAREKEAAALSQVEPTEVPPPLPNSASEDWDNVDEGNLIPSTELEQRGQTMGIELDNITRGLGSRIPVVIKEGKKRPEPPMQAAKLASEGRIILRQHIPIYTSWKEYKKDEYQLENFKGKLAIKFSMDGEKDDVTSVCADMLRGGTRQMRHRLKKLYFDGVPANQVRTTSPSSSMTDEEWKKLVDMWSDPKHKEKCAKSRRNREKVKLHGCTGSRSYIAAAYVAKKEKFMDTEPTAIDLFKLMHCSRTKGFSDDAKKAADDMEDLLTRTVQEGEQEKTCTEIVSHVLSKSSTFLRNVGLQKHVAAPKYVSPQMQELQAQLEAEKQESAGLREKLQRLEDQAGEAEGKAKIQAEEIENLKKSTEATQNLVRQMIAFGQSQCTQQITPP